jgi:hypothetical protein
MSAGGDVNPLYAAGYKVPAAHALLVAALGAHLAERAAYPSSPWQRVLEDAAELAGSPVEESPGVLAVPDRAAPCARCPLTYTPPDWS